MNNENEVNRSIIENSYYIINHFETSETEITNLKLQKLLYLAEALYMSIYKNETKLFNEEWIASESEPINNELHLKFNEFGNNIIAISDDEKNIGSEINKKNKRILDSILRIYGSSSYLDLLSLTTSESTAWEKNQKKNSDEFLSDKKYIIPKQEIKNWFTEYYKLNEKK